VLASCSGWFTSSEEILASHWMATLTVCASPLLAADITLYKESPVVCLLCWRACVWRNAGRVRFRLAPCSYCLNVFVLWVLLYMNNSTAPNPLWPLWQRKVPGSVYLHSSCENRCEPWVTDYGLDDGGAGVRVPVGSRSFSSPRRPDRLRFPPSLISNGYWGLFLRG
jgi:hypothetical protein